MRFTTRRGLLATVTGLLLGAACAPRESRTDAPGSRAIVDDFGDTLVLGAAPARLVSLNPATTEALFALGAGPRLVGRTHWDHWPDSARAVPDLGDGMRPDVERVLGARPDLVVLYASPSNRDAARALRRAGVPTLTLRTDRLDGFTAMVERLARAIGDSAAGIAVADSVARSLAAVRALARPSPAPRVLWPLWDRPILVAGGGSFLSELLAVAGAANVFADLDAPSPEVTFEEVVRRDPDVIVAGAASRARLLADPRWRTLRAVREGRIRTPDSLLVGRPGVRLGEAAHHLRRLLVDSLPPAPRP